jgi:valyl-tRNA synthetase
MRAELRVPPGKKTAVSLHFANTTLLTVFNANQGYLTQLAAVSTAELLPEGGAQPPQNALAAVLPGITIYLPLEGLIDIEKELARLGKEAAALEKEASRLDEKLSNQTFLAKAPPAVIEKETAKKEDCRERLAALQERIKKLTAAHREAGL